MIPEISGGRGKLYACHPDFCVVSLFSMKKDIHPKTRQVVFKDISSGFQIITSSSVESKQSIELEGKTYPLVSFDVSSASHPFYTGKQRLIDTEGRAERFVKKYKGFGNIGKKT